MKSEVQIPEPFLFNPLKHHLGYIRQYIDCRSRQSFSSLLNLKECSSPELRTIVRELKHLGTSVMDVYTGELSVEQVCNEIKGQLSGRKFFMKEGFSFWVGKAMADFRTVTLSDTSVWAVKYHNSELRWVHFFPARYSPHSFRVKSNTLKSALFYNILIGKDYITGDDLNRIRPLLGLSPVRDSADAEAVTEMIEIIRG